MHHRDSKRDANNLKRGSRDGKDRQSGSADSGRKRSSKHDSGSRGNSNRKHGTNALNQQNQTPKPRPTVVPVDDQYVQFVPIEMAAGYNVVNQSPNPTTPNTASPFSPLTPTPFTPTPPLTPNPLESLKVKSAENNYEVFVPVNGLPPPVEKQSNEKKVPARRPLITADQVRELALPHYGNEERSSRRKKRGNANRGRKFPTLPNNNEGAESTANRGKPSDRDIGSSRSKARRRGTKR
ncbi:hypothetical protein M3Y98_01180100 [Aphelenchoides besseyi]|nr:hypothetical protein M3Y98_01180100 [Aphelenchoides besseyi]KAI6211063.1 hypothetical protein M3Y96_00393500 [Aphelenchoides besseyi]